MLPPLQVNTTQTIYRNFQKLTLQETPGTVPAGRLPRHKEVILLHNLIDCARPGEEIQVVGTFLSAQYDCQSNEQPSMILLEFLNNIVQKGNLVLVQLAIN